MRMRTGHEKGASSTLPAQREAAADAINIWTQLLVNILRPNINIITAYSKTAFILHLIHGITSRPKDLDRFILQPEKILFISVFMHVGIFTFILMNNHRSQKPIKTIHLFIFLSHPAAQSWYFRDKKAPQFPCTQCHGHVVSSYTVICIHQCTILHTLSTISGQ